MKQIEKEGYIKTSDLTKRGTLHRGWLSFGLADAFSIGNTNQFGYVASIFCIVPDTFVVYFSMFLPFLLLFAYVEGFCLLWHDSIGHF